MILLNFKTLIGRFIIFFLNKCESCKIYYIKSQLAECGKDVCIGRYSDLFASHIHIGNNVYIGERASFLASVAHIYIGNYVMFGPNVTIRGGDHRVDVIGKHIYEITEKEKLPDNDRDVYVEDGVWVGCNSTILKGVTLGRGSVVAAGSVVTCSIPPYAIAGGVPARVIKFRFSEEEILKHEDTLKRRGML